MKETIVQVGDPILRQSAKTLPTKDIASKHLSVLIARMKKALAAERYGVAIAAPQLGESLRLFVVAGRSFKEEGAEETPADMVFINPELLRLSRKKHQMSEGCLSVRGKYGTVMRHEKASVRAYDESGKVFTYHGTGLIAHIFQHECDHLEGILYVDRAIHIENDVERNVVEHEALS